MAETPNITVRTPGRISPPSNSGASVIDQGLSVVTNRENQKRTARSFKKYEGSGGAPSGPKYRISMLEGGIMLTVAGLVDLVEFILGLLAETGVGEVINLIIDIIFALCLTSYCAFFKRMSFAAHWQRYASIAGAFIGELVPVVNIAQFWILDVWYIIHTIRSEDRADFESFKAKALQDEQRQQIENYEGE